jgi:hypothetical protein
MPVKPYGEGRYVVYAKSKYAMRAQTAALDAAQVECGKANQQPEPVSNDKLGHGQYRLVFTCK